MWEKRLFVCLVTWITAKASPVQPTGRDDLPILIPDLSNVDSYALQRINADKFLTLWHINVLSGPILISDEPWTVLIPQNTGLPKDPRFIIDTEYTRQILLNHVIIGDIIDAKNASKNSNLSFYSLADTELKFTGDGNVTFVNGVRLMRDVLEYKNGKIYVIEGIIEVSQPDYLKFVPDLKENIFNTLGFISKGDKRQQPSKSDFTKNTTFSKKPEANSPPKSNGPRKTRFEKFRYQSLKESSKNSENLAKELSPGSTNDEAERLDHDGEFLSSAGFSKPFPESMLAEAKIENSFAREFYHHLLDANLNTLFIKDQDYTAIIPTDIAFYNYYPIDWGFNPFLVKNFTKDVLLSHIIPKKVNLYELQNGTELETIEGKIITIHKKEGNKIEVNGEAIFPEFESEVHKGRIYYINNLLFVDLDRVYSLRDQYPYLETGPLIAYPWPTSPFLSHLVKRLKESPNNTIFINFLLKSSVTHRFPRTDDNYKGLSYSAFVPTDAALRNVFTIKQLEELQQPYQSSDAKKGSSTLTPEEINNFVLNHLFHGYIMEKDLNATGTLLSMTEKKIPYIKSNDLIKVGRASVLGKQQYLYNLGAIYHVDNTITGSNKLPDQSPHVTEVTQLPVPQLNTKKHKDKGEVNPFSTNPITEIIFPSVSDPGYRFETRTEVSYSRQINNGEIIPVTKEQVEREKRMIA